MQRSDTVTADDLEEGVRLAVDALRPAVDADWGVRAGRLEWDCPSTVGHIASDLVAYAGLVTSRATHRYAPFEIHLEDDADPTGYLEVLTATGGILAAVVRAAPDDVEVWHVYGPADREAVAAMGLVEVLVHTEDLSRGLGVPWTSPAHLSARVLRRLFPGAPADPDPWLTLLWATGRGSLPGRNDLTRWRWDNRRR